MDEQLIIIAFVVGTSYLVWVVGERLKRKRLAEFNNLLPRRK